MKRNVRLFFMLLVASLVAGLGLITTHARAQPAPDRNTACGTAASGLKADGSGTLIKLTAVEAAGQRVNADGVWEFCKITANRACGQGGTALMPGRGVIDLTPAEAPGLKIDEGGVWRECASCLPREPNAFRTWMAGNAECTSRLPNDSNPNSPARDGVLLHGQVGSWSQWTGAMRGFLIEACWDGQRTQRAASCQPATGCDTLIAFDRTYLGVTRGYAYDGRAKPILNGKRAMATAADGSTWPIACSLGSWDVPESLPTVAPADPVAPVKLGGCGSRTFAAREGLQGLVYWRYAGARVPVGELVALKSTDGKRSAQGVCQADGSFGVIN